MYIETHLKTYKSESELVSDDVRFITSLKAFIHCCHLQAWLTLNTSICSFPCSLQTSGSFCLRPNSDEESAPPESQRSALVTWISARFKSSSCINIWLQMLTLIIAFHVCDDSENFDVDSLDWCLESWWLLLMFLWVSVIILCIWCFMYMLLKKDFKSIKYPP